MLHWHGQRRQMAVTSNGIELLQGTLDLIVLQALATMGPLHAYALAARLEQVSEHPFTLNQGTLYASLVRLDQRGWIKGTWRTTENNREAKYYAITKAGTRALEQQTDRWRRLSGLVEKLLLERP
jgi:PadR family transcriptional regulator, regulatory protein PadR